MKNFAFNKIAHCTINNEVMTILDVLRYTPHIWKFFLPNARETKVSIPPQIPILIELIVRFKSNVPSPQAETSSGLSSLLMNMILINSTKYSMYIEILEGNALLATAHIASLMDT